MRLVLEILGALVLGWGLLEILKLVFRGAQAGHRAIDEESTRTFDDCGEHGHVHLPQKPKDDQRRDRARRGPRNDDSTPPKE